MMLNFKSDKILLVFRVANAFPLERNLEATDL